MIDIATLKKLAGMAAPRRSHTAKFLDTHPLYIPDFGKEANVKWMHQHPEVAVVVLPRLVEGLVNHSYDELCPEMAVDEFESLKQFLEEASAAAIDNGACAPLPPVSAGEVTIEQASTLSNAALDESVLEVPNVLVCCKCEMSHLNAEFQANKISMVTMLARIQELTASTFGDQPCSTHQESELLAMSASTPLPNKPSRHQSPLADLHNSPNVDTEMLRRAEEIRKMRVRLCQPEQENVAV
eukprot:m.221979 g.221979  ORF g.221979 m.221979 type:complete len:241 (-) comp17252_c0_seq39:668-1390(-)